MADPRMQTGAMSMPFDGKRLVYGGFEILLDTGPTRCNRPAVQGRCRKMQRRPDACQLALYQSPGICGGFNLTLRAERLRMLMLSASTPSENAIAK